MMEELRGLEKQVNECLIHAYDKGVKDGKTMDAIEGYKAFDDGYKKGLADRIITEEAAIACLGKSGWMQRHDEAMLSYGIKLGMMAKEGEKQNDV